MTTAPTADLNIRILKTGKIFNIHWVASHFKTVKEVRKDYPALAQLLGNSNGNDKKKFRVLQKHTVMH